MKSLKSWRQGLYFAKRVLQNIPACCTRCSGRSYSFSKALLESCEFYKCLSMYRIQHAALSYFEPSSVHRILQGGLEFLLYARSVPCSYLGVEANNAY
jgi:hypothetical protein